MVNMHESKGPEFVNVPEDQKRIFKKVVKANGEDFHPDEGRPIVAYNDFGFVNMMSTALAHLYPYLVVRDICLDLWSWSECLEVLSPAERDLTART